MTATRESEEPHGYYRRLENPAFCFTDEEVADIARMKQERLDHEERELAKALVRSMALMETTEEP